MTFRNRSPMTIPLTEERCAELAANPICDGAALRTNLGKHIAAMSSAPAGLGEIVEALGTEGTIEP